MLSSLTVCAGVIYVFYENNDGIYRDKFFWSKDRAWKYFWQEISQLDVSAVPVKSEQTKRPFIWFLPAIKSPIRMGIWNCGLSPVFSASVLMFCRHIRSTTMPVDIKIFLKRATTITYDNCFCKMGQISTNEIKRF